VDNSAGLYTQLTQIKTRVMLHPDWSRQWWPTGRQECSWLPPKWTSAGLLCVQVSAEWWSRQCGHSLC